MRAFVVAASLALSAAASPALAWNGRGHMVVAAIAWDQMTPAARAKASELLKLNPQYATWTASTPEPEKGHIAFLRAATWPDFIRTAPGYRDDKISAPEASQEVGYALDKLRHTYWHYKDLPFSPDGTPVQQPLAPNAETQIRAFTATLASSSASDDVKAYDLAWILHLVGDVHQPLHATSRYTSDLPNGDRGGNEVVVCRATATSCSETKGKPLHTFWDHALGESDRTDSAIAKARTMAKAPATKAAITDSAAWLNESLSVAKTAVYATPIKASHGPFTLTNAYEVKAGSYAERRVALAGARLARLLNAPFQ
ncbi:S1/P1 nuclease [Phenylobacterium sp.]|uniref:S1/P1 nuclease n=1 Tax=Phenylobacterium sp. TaxID=1871053 RepID=UPI003BABEF79